mgnify:CR=1 FL=1
MAEPTALDILLGTGSTERIDNLNASTQKIADALQATGKTVLEVESALVVPAFFVASTYAFKDLVLGDGKAFLQLIGFVAFMEFIQEEAIQAASFPISMLIRNKQLAAAQKQTDALV